MSLFGIAEIAAFGSKMLERVVPSAAEAEKAKLALAELVQSGELQQLATSAQIRLADAKSGDVLAARARPWFLYVMYIIMLASLPMGICEAINPSIAKAIELGMTNWFKAIPIELWLFFGVAYTGDSFLYIKKVLLDFQDKKPTTK